MTWVKICGQTSPEGVRGAVANGADALGFIFVPGVRRQRSPEQVAAWTAAVSPAVERVGVFLNQPTAEILAVAAAARLTAIQLHGQEPPEQVQALQQAGYAVIKTVHLSTAEDLSHLQGLEADAILLEPRVAGQHGGTGTALDAALASEAVQAALALPAHPSRLPRLILAGGLTPETVAQAIATTGAPGVDVSSGVETDGVKDPERIAAFLAAVRQQADSHIARREQP